MKKAAFPLAVCLFLAMTGCTPKTLPPSSAEINGAMTATTAAERWQIFLQRSAEARTGDALSGSLRFGTEDETHRVTYLLWSGQSSASGSTISDIIRLDIGTGLGSTVGSMRIADGRMILVIPGERKAYIGEASQENLRRLLGLSLPFSVDQLADFLSGRFFSALDSPVPAGYEIQKDGSILYRYVQAGRSMLMVLDAQARPVLWEEGMGWKLDITCDENGRPTKLSGRAKSVSGYQRLVLMVKERRVGTSTASLELAIPAGFTVYSLD